MIGRIVSTKLKNTATILVERTAKHPLYKKTFKRSKRYLVDVSLGVKDGDIVEVVQTRPHSKNKHWKIVKVLGKSLAEIAEQQMKEKAAEIIAEVMPEEKEGYRVQGIGSSEEKIKNKKVEEKKERTRKEKLVPKP